MAAKLRLAAAWLTLLSAGFEGQQALGGQQGGSSGPPWLRLAALPAAAAQPTINLDSLGPAGLSARQLWEGLCSSGAPQVSVVEKTIGGAHADMLAGRLTCSSLVAAYLQRIAALDQRMQLNSIRAVHPAAVRRAAQLDGQLAEARVRGAGALPPLFCVPLLVKDNIDVRGLATTAGSVGLDDNFPPQDAHIIGLLQQRGALVLAKTAMGEFGFFPSFTISSVSGVVRNPYSLSHSPAGSSGGSAAACAASLGMAALGTDTGNSVRGPASHTSLVGLRPSLGLVSRTGVVPLRRDRDTVGPLARTVEDAVRVFEAMVGPDPLDNHTLAQLNLTLPANYTQFLTSGGLAGARIGVLRQISELPGADGEVSALFQAALGALGQAGATLVDFRIAGNLLGSDWDADRGGEGPAIGHWNVAGRWEDLWACQSPFRVGLDEYLAAGNASSRHRNLAELVGSGDYHPDVADEVAASLRAAYPPGEYPGPAMRAVGMVCGCADWQLDPCRTEFRKRLVESMDAAFVAALVYPTWNTPPLRVGEKPGDDHGGNNSPMIAPHTGAPAITVPMGFTGQGLPTGLQFLGRPFDEPGIIRLAYAYEQGSRARRPPPLFPECSSPEPGTPPHGDSSFAG